MLSLSQIAILRGISASWWNVLSSSTCQCKTRPTSSERMLAHSDDFFPLFGVYLFFSSVYFFYAEKKRPGRKISESRLEMEEKCKVREMHTKNSVAEPRGSALKSVYDRAWAEVWMGINFLLHGTIIARFEAMESELLEKKADWWDLKRLREGVCIGCCRMQTSVICGEISAVECLNAAIVRFEKNGNVSENWLIETEKE